MDSGEAQVQVTDQVNADHGEDDKAPPHPHSDGAALEVNAPHPTRRTRLYVLLVGMVTLGVLTAFFVVFAIGLSSVQEHRNQFVLRAQMRGLLDPSSPVAPYIGGSIPAGAPVALLRAPGAGLSDVVVVEGSASPQMVLGPGHLPNSALPGQVGQSIIIGRSATTGAPFSGITKFKIGQRFDVVTGQGSFRYKVTGTRVGGSKLPEIPQSGSLLTMVAATGSGPLGSVLNGHLIYVDAALQGQAVPTPKGRPTQVSAASVQGASDLAALPVLAVWLGLSMAFLVAATWLLRRWGWRRAWLILAPLSLGLLWGLSNQLLKLVPNVY